MIHVLNLHKEIPSFSDKPLLKISQRLSMYGLFLKSKPPSSALHHEVLLAVQKEEDEEDEEEERPPSVT